MSIKLTVVLPVYNAEKYVKDAINSVLNQTYRDFEFIIIDDGSKDDSLAVIKQCVGSDSRVKVISRENKGLAYTLNEGASLAQGEFYARMDADDIATLDRFEKQMNFIAKHELDICGAWHKLFGAQQSVVPFPETEDEIRIGLLFNSPFSHPTVIMKSHIIKDLGYRTEFNGAEDYDLWERAVRAGYRMYNIPEVLYYYRIHPDQVSSAAYSKQRQLGHEIRVRSVDFIADYYHILPSDLKLVTLPRERALTISEVKNLAIVAHHLGVITEFSIGVYERITHLLYMCAGSQSFAFFYWLKLSKKFNHPISLEKMVIFIVIIMLRVKYESPLFYRLKSFLYRLKNE
jgi:glycosyltransferase involved in cell wall biosynthesis